MSKLRLVLVVATAAAVAVMAAPSSHAAATTTTTDSNNGTSPGCRWSLIQCQNNGYFLDKNCTYCFEQGQRTEEDDWDAQNTCVCPSDYGGVECVLERPSLCKKNKKIFDSSLVNLNLHDKPMECFVEYNDKQSSLELENHRVEYNVDYTGRSVEFTLYTRPHSDSLHCFEPMIKGMNCKLWECSFETVRGTPDNRPFRWTCKQSNCAAGPNAPIILQVWVAQVKPPIYLNWENYTVVPDNGGLLQTRGELRSVMNLGLRCVYGQCVDVPPDENISVYKAYVYVTIIVVVVVVGGCVLLSVLAYRSNNIDRTAPHKRADYIALQEASASMGDEEDGHGAARPAARRCAGDAASSDTRLLFRDVCYDVPKRRILHNVAGEASSGEVFACLGLSGSGKTSLLDILGFRRKVGDVSGEVVMLRDGKRMRTSTGQLPDGVCYMSSESLFLETQTVFETILFSALLRIGAGESGAPLSGEELRRRVWDVIYDVDLGEVAHTKVGSESAGGGSISSGERKRLAIAVELVTEPRVLLLDEPTSGLDSYNSQVLMEVIQRNVKRRGLLCVLSIHQPPTKVFECFDKVLVLSRTGHTAYCGPRDACLDYFASELKRPCPPHTNPAEFLLEEASSHDDQSLEECVDAYANSDMHRQLLARIDDALHARGDDGGLKLKPTAGFRRQLVALNLRMWRHLARKPGLFVMTQALTIVSAVLLGIIYYRVDNQFAGAQDRIGFLFFVIFFFSLASLSAVPEFVEDRNRFLRERYDRYYDTLPYMISKVTIDILPMRIVPPLLFGSITYWLVGLQSDPLHFVTFLVVLCMTNAAATAACFCFSCLAPSSDRASLMAAVYFIFCMLFGGLLLNLGSQSGSPSTPYVRWLRFLSFHHFGFSALMRNEVADVNVVINHFSATGRFLLGDSVLAIAHDTFLGDAMGLVGIMCGFWLIAFASLKWGQDFRR